VDAAVGLGLFSKDGGTEVEAELDGVDLDEVEVETNDGGDEEEDDIAGEDGEECVESHNVFVDVIGPFVLEEIEWAKDKRGDKESEEGDADETPEVEKTLLEQSAETGRCVGLVAEEGSGDEEKVDDEIERDGGVTCNAPGVSEGALVEVQGGFTKGSKIEATREALGSEGVIKQFGELEVEGDGEEKRQSEIEEVGPEERRETTQNQREAVKEDVAAFVHGQETSVGLGAHDLDQAIWNQTIWDQTIQATS